MQPMPADIEDTIVALSSAPGRGGRAIVRLSGPNAFEISFTFFKPTSQHSAAPNSSPIGPEYSVPSTPYSVLGTPMVRRRHEGFLRLPDFQPFIPASLLAWPGPKTYTGQDLAELHLLACPSLVDLLVASLLNAGARAAQPGEFTLRAFLVGKLDLPRAEAVLGVIEAGNRDDLKQALAQLAGGVTRPLEGLRHDLLDLLA